MPPIEFFAAPRTVPEANGSGTERKGMAAVTRQRDDTPIAHPAIRSLPFRARQDSDYRIARTEPIYGSGWRAPRVATVASCRERCEGLAVPLPSVLVQVLLPCARRESALRGRGAAGGYVSDAAGKQPARCCASKPRCQSRIPNLRM